MIVFSAVGYDVEASRDKAQLLALKLNYTLEKDANVCLFVSADKLALKMCQFSLLSADFTASTWQKRKAEGKKQGLIRACKPTRGLKIIDATAGWGRDAAILASFGAEVLMIERHPAMAALLDDALLHQSEKDKQLMHLSLFAGDTLSFLSQLRDADCPDVIYIDPMHPERTKSALVKKDMQALQQIIGADDDALALIKCAITKAKQKVVVKWPQKIKSLLAANASIEGKTVRFDIYTARGLSITSSRLAE
ncbi:MAG: class I SAM-dependent methyltransferase [Legionellales bacterium]